MYNGIIWCILYLAPVPYHCGMYTLLSDDKHRKVRDSSRKCTGNLRQIQSETKFSLRIFSDGQKKFFFQTEFCLGLNLSRITYRSCISYAIFYLLHFSTFMHLRSFYFFYPDLSLIACRTSVK